MGSPLDDWPVGTDGVPASKRIESIFLAICVVGETAADNSAPPPAATGEHNRSLELASVFRLREDDPVSVREGV